MEKSYDKSGPPRTSTAFDPEYDDVPVEGPASGGKIAMFAIAVAVVLGAVFYGLSNSKIESKKVECPQGYVCTKIP